MDIHFMKFCFWQLQFWEESEWCSFNNRSISFVTINTFFLIIFHDNQTCFMSFTSYVDIIFDVVSQFRCNNFISKKELFERPCVILIKFDVFCSHESSLNFKFHSITKMNRFISKSYSCQKWCMILSEKPSIKTKLVIRLIDILEETEAELVGVRTWYISCLSE